MLEIKHEIIATFISQNAEAITQSRRQPGPKSVSQHRNLSEGGVTVLVFV